VTAIVSTTASNTHVYVHVHVCMYRHRKNYKLSYLERRNGLLELNMCYLDEVKFFAVNICQMFSSDGRDQAGHNGTVVHRTV